MGRLTGEIAETVASLVAQVEELAPRIEAAAAAGDLTGDYDPGLYEELTKRGLFDLVTPKAFGGFDMTPFEALHVYEAVGSVDVVTAWLMMVIGNNRKYLEMLDFDVAEEFYADGSPAIAGSVAPSGTAERVDGGYRITGRWGYASGYPQAEWVSGAAVVTEGGEPVLDTDGNRQTIVFLAPRALSVEEGNWDVVGLRATQSVDHSLTDAFVPTKHVVPGSYAQAKWGGRSALVGFTAWLIFTHTSIEIGVGRGILDEALAHANTASYRKGTASQSEVFRHEYAQAEAAYRSARAWMWEVWGEIDETVNSGLPVTQAQLTDARNVVLHFNRVNRKNAAFVFEEVGGTSIRPSRIQRLYRDHLTASTHVQVNRKFYQLVARSYLGQAEGLVWTPHDLIPAPKA